MNTQTKSEELAKLLGVTRKYCTKCGARGYIGEDYIKNDIFECCMCHCKDYEIKTNSELDFTKPSNFVKLFQIYFDTHFEIWTDAKDIGMPAYFKKYTKSIQEWLINYLLYCYHSGQTVPPEYGNKYETWKKLLKLTAQKIEWEY